MPTAAASQIEAPASPGEVAFHMLDGILHQPKMDVHAKLAALRELCVERISFDSPAQAIEIISALAEIISTDPEPEVRVAALEAMERMISLEQKAETELGKPAVDWRTVNILLHRARKQTQADTAPVASRFGAPSPESPVSLAPQPVRSTPVPPPAAATKPAGDDDIAPAEAALLAAQEAAVSAIQKGKPAVVPPSPTEPVAEAPAPTAARPGATAAPSPTPAATQAPEPPIMKFLRAIADTDSEEETVRELANRIITRIESLTVIKPGAAPTPTLTES